MLHPSYTDLMKVVNNDADSREESIVSSRYSIVIATAKRARQIISGDAPMIEGARGKKPFSIAVEELYQGKVRILSEEEAAEREAERLAALAERERAQEEVLEEEVEAE